MFKKIFSLICLFFSVACYGETCPSITDIKQNQFREWKPLDIDNAEPVVGKRLEQFKQKVHHFAMANWMPDAPEGAGQCFYNGIVPDIDYLGVYFVKATSEPDKNMGNWHQASFAVMSCDASIETCRFKN